jgi:Leu/Phe-tRNA-protein transferase
VQTLERIIEEHPFFEGLDHGFMDLVLGCATNVRFGKDTYIFKEGYEVLKRFAGIVAQRLESTRFQLLDVFSAQK